MGLAALRLGERPALLRQLARLYLTVGVDDGRSDARIPGNEVQDYG